MSFTVNKLFTPAFLAGSVGVIFAMPTSPSNGCMKNGRLRLTNTSASTVAVTLYVDASGTGSGAVNTFLSAANITAGASLDVDIPTMASGDTLRGFAGTAGVVNVIETGGVIQYP